MGEGITKAAGAVLWYRSPEAYAGSMACLAAALASSIMALLLPPNPVRAVVSLGWMLFAPGYLVSAIVWPRRDSISLADRLVLSVVLSIAITIITALGLSNLWEVGPLQVTAAHFAITLVAFLASVSLRDRLCARERFSITVPSARRWLSGVGGRTGVVIVAVLLLASTITLYSLAFAPRADDGYSELYLLNEAGGVELPRSLRPGQETSVLLGLHNMEGHAASYNITITLMNNDTGAVTTVGGYDLRLSDSETWEHLVSFSPAQSGSFVLSAVATEVDGDQDPLEVHYWIEVS